MRIPTVGVSVVIPTYGRDRALTDTIGRVLKLRPAPAEVLIIDQTARHHAATETALASWAARSAIRWVRLERPSIPAAMNQGLVQAGQEVVLFLDDDIEPEPGLIGAHLGAHRRQGDTIVAGLVIQPWHADPSNAMTEASNRGASDFMGGNFSVRRDAAVRVGGFDERFVRVAYRFEAEFAARFREAGGSICFQPTAAVRHLKEPRGGTRSFGDHLRTMMPSHAVGEYYYLLRARPLGWMAQFVRRPWRSFATRHHLRRPWWILPTLIAEALGICWSLCLWLRGPKLMPREG